MNRGLLVAAMSAVLVVMTGGQALAETKGDFKKRCEKSGGTFGEGDGIVYCEGDDGSGCEAYTDDKKENDKADGEPTGHGACYDSSGKTFLTWREGEKPPRDPERPWYAEHPSKKQR